MKLNVKAPLHQNFKQQQQFPSFRMSSSRNEEQKKDPFIYSSDPNKNRALYQLGPNERPQARSGQGRYEQYQLSKQSPSNQVHSVSQHIEPSQSDPFPQRQKLQQTNNTYKDQQYEDATSQHINQRSISTSLGRADNYYSTRYTPESQTLQRQSQFFENNTANNYMSTGDNFHNKLEKQFKDVLNQNLQFGYNQQRQSEPRLSSSRPKQQAFSSLLSTQNSMISQICEQIKYDQGQILDAFEGEFIDFINSNYNSFTENDIVGMFARLKAQLDDEVEKGLKNNKIQQLGGGLENKENLKENLTKMMSSIIQMLDIDQLTNNQGGGGGSTTNSNQQRSLMQTFNKSQELDLMGSIENNANMQQSYLELIKTQRQLQEIKVINDKLHHEMQIINEKVNSLKAENSQLSLENDRFRKISSPIRLTHHQDNNFMERNIRSSSPYQSQHDMNTNEEIQSLRHKLRQIQQDKNDEFQKVIRNMNREMDQKAEEVERLNFELEKYKNAAAKDQTHSRYQENNLRSPAPISPSMFTINSVSNEQVQFYKEYSDKQVDKLQSLLKRTTKFLQSMKKLQKAVHKKEPNVTKEKAEFEESRKDLESYIRTLQKENDVKNKDVQSNRTSKVPGREQSIDGGHSYLQSAKYSLLLDYQSKAPNTFQRNDNNPSITNLKSKQSTSHLQQQLSSLSQTQASKSFNPQNKYIISNSLLNTIGKESDQHESISKGVSSYNIRHNHIPNQERSPIPLRQTVTNFNRYNQQEMFRSLEAVDRRPQFASLERDREAYRSPSVHKDKDNKQSSQNKRPSSIDKSAKKYQISNMKSEIGLLKQEAQDLINERNHMKNELEQVKRDSQTLITDNQQLAKQLERDRRKQEVTRREMNDLILEKESLLHEFKRLSSNFNPVNLSKNDNQYDQDQEQERDQIFQQIQDDNQLLQQQLKLMQDEIKLFEQADQAHKRTIGFLEENEDVAKQTIIDLKEALASKDIELEENKIQVARKEQDKQVQQLSEREMKVLKQSLIEQIEGIREDNEVTLKGIQDSLNEKDDKINKVKRLIDRKLKEKEIQKDNQNEKEVQAKIQSLQAQVKGKPYYYYHKFNLPKELENRCQDEDLAGELEKVQTKLDQKVKQLQDLQSQYAKEKQQFEKRIQELDVLRKREKEELLVNHSSEIEDITSQFELQQESVKLECKKEFEQQYKVQKEELIKDQKKRLEQIKRDNELLIVEIKSEHQEELDELIEKHQQEIESQRKLTELQITNLKKQQKTYEESQRQVLGQSNERLKELEQQISEQDNQKDEEIQELQQNISQQKESIRKFEKVIKEKDTRIQQIQEQMTLQQQENDETIIEINQTLTNIQADKDKEIQSMVQEMKQLKEKHTHEKQQLCDQIKALNKQIVDLTSSNTDLESQQEVLRKQLGNEKGELVKTKEQEISLLKQSILKDKQTYSAQLESKDKSIQNALQQISDLQQSLASHNNLKQEFIQLQTSLNQVQKQSHEQLQSKQDELVNHQGLFKQLQQKLANEQDSYTQQLKQKDAILKQKDELLKQKEDQFKSVGNDVSQLNTSIAQQQNTHKDQITGLNSQIEQLKKALKQSQDSLQEYEQEIQSRDQQIEDNSQTIQDKDNEITGLTHDIAQQKGIIQRLEQKVQAKHQQMGSEVKQQIEQAQNEVKQIQEEKDALSQQVKNAQNELNSKSQTIKDIENENKYTKTLQLSLKKQLEEIQLEMQQKEKASLENHGAFEQEREQLQAQLKQKGNEVRQAFDQQASLKQEVKDKEQEHQKLIKHNEQVQNELSSKVKQKEIELESKQKEFVEMQQRKDQLIQQTKEERDHAHEQLSSMVNQTKFEKKSLEENLQQQLSDAIKSLQLKERESGEKDLFINQLEKQLKEIELREEILAQKNQILDDQNQQLQEELQEAQNSSDQKQTTLETNRNLIQMLKIEFEKSINKQRDLEQQLSNTTQVSEEQNKYKDENNKLKDKLQHLRGECDEKIMTIQMKVDELETEQKLKTELIDDANKVIEDFNDEKHEIKARFKHLMTILEEVDDESSYKEDDEIELEECFDRLEKELMKWMNRKDNRILQFEKDATIVQEMLKTKEEELNQLQAKMGEVKCELMNALNKQESNDIEMRRQMDTAGRKIENYKEKLIEKQKQLNQLESERKIQPTVSAKLDDSMIKENIELIQKLQKAENELQTYRLASMKKFSSSHNNSEDQNSKEDIERLQSLEDQINQLRKQLFQAKDQVISNLSDTFAKRIKDLQQTYINENILKDKLAELNHKKVTQAQQLDINSQIKECKRVKIADRNLLVAYSAQTQSYYLLDQQFLNETQMSFLRSFVNQIEGDDLKFDPKQEEVVKKLVDQIKEMREERQEMKMELTQYKSRASQGGAQQNLDELQLLRLEELEDDLGHTNAENQELRLNIKELSLLNSQQKLRIIELNSMIQDYIPSSGDNFRHENSQTIFEKVINLEEENKQLQNLLEDEKRKSSLKLNKYYREEIKESHKKYEENGGEPSFIEQMRRPDNGNGQNDDSNLFNQSSIEGVIEGLGGDDQMAPSKEALQQKINKLEVELEGLNKKYRNLTAEVQKSQQTLNPTEASVIEHIKGTLIQFLKNTPLTEKNNEELLAIVFSMMEFTKEEVQDVQNFRQKMRLHSQTGSEPDEEMKRQAKKGFLNMFKKKERDSSSKPNSSSDRQNIQSPSPIRPIKKQ